MTDLEGRGSAALLVWNASAVLFEENRGAKLAAMVCYRTQFPALDGGSKRMLSDPAIHGFEVHWDLL